MSKTVAQCPLHGWCERGAESHFTHRRQDRTVRLSSGPLTIAVVAAGSNPERLIQLFGMWLTISEARDLGGALVDVAHRFN